MGKKKNYCPNEFGHSKSVNQRIREVFITYCVCDFLFHGYPCILTENMMLQYHHNHNQIFD